MVRRTLSALGFAYLTACTGTDTGNPPVVGFDASGCKSKGEKARTNQVTEPAAGYDDRRYDGLTCLIWSRPSAETLRVDLTNYATGCHVDQGWSPRARRAADGALELVLEDEECSIAGCGSCLYDLSFYVQIEGGADLPVRIFQEGCDQDSTPSPQAVLPLSSRSSGAVCAHTIPGVLQWHANLTGTIGQRHMPCAAAMGTVQCADGLACTAVEAGSQLCLASCLTDADCDSLTRCEAGVCKLGATGLTLVLPAGR